MKKTTSLIGALSVARAQPTLFLLTKLRKRRAIFFAQRTIGVGMARATANFVNAFLTGAFDVVGTARIRSEFQHTDALTKVAEVGRRATRLFLAGNDRRCRCCRSVLSAHRGPTDE